MKTYRLFPVLALLLFTGIGVGAFTDDTQEVKEKSLQAPNNLTIKVRMEGPYTADTPLQVVCYFKHKSAGDKTLGAAVELDKELGGIIAALRNRGEFEGEALETILLTPPPGTIKAKRLLLIGLGDEESLSLERLEQVGRVAVRVASQLGVNRVAFAPLIRDQGNAKLPAGDVARSVLRGVQLAYDTEKRLQKEGLAKEFTLEQWSQEAGPQYFDETVTGALKATKEVDETIKARSASPYAEKK
jgi:hypothetical protein